MDNIKDDRYYIAKIIKDTKFIIDHMQGVTLESFTADEVLNNCICFKLIQISENASKVSDTSKAKALDIPWRNITGLRNRIVHAYGSTDMHILYDTVTKDMEPLMEILLSLL